MNKQIRLFTLLFTFAVMFASVPGLVFGEDETKVEALNPVPELTLDGAAVPGIVREGRLSAIDNKGIYISESFYQFSDSVIFLSEKRKPVSRSAFDTGEMVEFRLNSKGKIVALWLQERRD